jgi:hypothetical protein
MGYTRYMGGQSCRAIYVCKGHEKSLLRDVGWSCSITIQPFYIDMVVKNHTNHNIYVKVLKGY